MTNDLISREALKEQTIWTKVNNGVELIDIEVVPLDAIDNAQAVELDESVIQEVLNKRCMTAVANDYLKALHSNRPQGEWARHDIWVGGEYAGGFYHVNCPIEDGYYSKWTTNFCPNCGQPMMKEDAK